MWLVTFFTIVVDIILVFCLLFTGSWFLLAFIDYCIDDKYKLSLILKELQSLVEEKNNYKNKKV